MWNFNFFVTLLFTSATAFPNGLYVDLKEEGIVKQLNDNVGKKAKEKCVAYSKWSDSYTLKPGNEKIEGTCTICVEKFIIAGESAKQHEFPHMAHLGYLNKDNPTYSCGASLISKQYLLTAAHCLENRPLVAKLGENDEAIIVKIDKIIPHPEYESRRYYHDIALLRLEDKIETFRVDIRPACIQVERDIKAPEGIATGWGLTESNQPSKVLMKVSLPFTSHSQCSKSYPPRRTLARGIDDDGMICAGNATLKRDTCQGDSGGPIQFSPKEPNCMYNIVGITSFGDVCGKPPGVFTRVSNYVSWIESIVWPDGEDEDKDVYVI